MNEEITLRFKKLRPGAVIPTRGSALSAGYDLYACLEESVTIAPGETKGMRRERRRVSARACPWLCRRAGSRGSLPAADWR